MSFSQIANPIVDLNSTTTASLALTGDTAELKNPFSNGWTRNAPPHDADVLVYEDNIYFTKDNGQMPYFALSPTVTDMNIGPGSSGAARLVVGWGWNQGDPSTGKNTASVSYNGEDYALFTTGGTANTGVLTYLNGATNADGTTDPVYINASSFRNWAFATITIDLPKGVASSGNIGLVFKYAYHPSTSPHNRDDVAFAFVRPQRYAGDDDYNFSNTFTEDGSPVGIADPAMSIVDDGKNLTGATITLANPKSNDALSILTTLPGGITATINANNTEITLSGTASITDYTTAIKHIRFGNSSDMPNTTARTINVSLTDADNQTSNTAVATITVLEVNDPPMGTDKTINVIEEATYTFSAADFGFSDPAENHQYTSVTIATLPINGALKLNGVAVTVDQVIPVANIPQLTWKQIDESANGTAFDSFTFEVGDNGGTANGGLNVDPSANTITFNVAASSDLSVTKTVSSSTPNMGSNVTFQITVANAGPSNATQVELTDVLPSGYTFVSASAPAGTSYNNMDGKWAIGNLTDGNSVTLSITAKVKTSGNYKNTAAVTANEDDPDSTNNTASVTPVPVPIADMSVTKMSNTGNPNVGSTIVFSITAANAGPSNATNVKVTDVLPSGYTFVSATAPAGTSYDSTTGVWTIGNMANGGNATLTISATVKASGSYANTATITADQSDSNSANNTATATPTPVPVADLSVNKANNNSTPNVGSNITFTITAANAGPSNATSVTVNDLLPSGYTFVSANAPAGTSYNSTSGVWTIGSLANGANVALGLTATVKASGNYANVAKITGNESDPGTANNSATSTPTPVPVADVSVNKTASDDTPNVGSDIIFTITASNAGPSEATNVKVTDVLPNGYTFVSATAPAGTTYNSTTGVWSIGHLANGTNSILVIAATVKAAGNYANTATITATENDPNNGNNSSTITPVPVPVADVAVTKTASVDSPDVGSSITFTITATNNGPSDATSVNVTDVLPSGYTFVSASAPAGTTYNSTTGLWAIGNLVNGADAILNITATVNASGNYTNTATVSASESDPDTGNNTATASPSPVPVADVAITKTVDENTPDVGSNVVFTVTAANTGPSEATNVKVNDILPNGYTFVSAAAPTGTTYSNTNGIWTVGNLAKSGSVTLTITATVNPSGNYINTANATATEKDPDTSNNTASATVAPVKIADVAVAKTVDNSAPNVGSNVTFTVSATNGGPSTATNVSVNDALPNGYTFVSATASGTTSYNSTTGMWTVGSLINGANAILSITARVNATGDYSNTATISASEKDPDNSNNTATATPGPIATADLSITKTASDNNPAAGTSITFTITTTNTGPSNATNVEVTDMLPTGYTFVSASAPTGTTYNNTTGKWAVGNLNNGSSSTLTITVTVNASGNHANTAVVTASENDPDDSNNSATANPFPSASADLSVTKTVNFTSPYVGSTVIFTITANNAGPSAATNVKVTDKLPGGYTFVSATAPAGTSYNSGTGVWAIGNLANGANSVLSIQARVNASGDRTNTADITASENDPNTANNSASAATTPRPVTDVSISKTVSNSNPNVGSDVTFTVTTINKGPSAATDVEVTDVLPNGYAFVSAQPSGGTTYDNATGAWVVGNLANGANATLTITATVKASGDYANTASVTAKEYDPDTSNNEATATLVAIAMSDLSVTKTASNDKPEVGTNIVFTITAANAGPSDATNVKVNDLLPNGYTFVSATAASGTAYDSATGVWTIGNLNNGANTALTITATVNASGNYANTATITANENDPSTDNNTSTSTPAPVPIADVSVTKTVDDNTPDVGSNVIFSITAANAGPSAATNVQVSDPLPNGYTFVSASAPAGTSYNSTTGVWTIGNLAKSGNTTLAITATVNASGNRNNTAVITASEKDPNRANNTASKTTAPIAVADMRVSKTVNKSQPNVGTDVIFTITASNAGPSNATNVKVTDMLPDGYTFVSASTSGNTTYDSVSGLWTIGNMTNGSSIALSITATVNSTGDYTNTATITANEQDSDNSNNTATATPTPTAAADLSVTKTASNNNPYVGSNIVFTIAVANMGPSNATNVTAIDLLPTGYSFVSATAPAGTSYDSATGEWTIGNLTNGTNISLSITAVVNDSGDYANTATVTGDENDPSLTNNTATSTPFPIPSADVTVTKTVNNNSPNVGTDVIFTITASNGGPSNATDVKVTDALPGGYSFVSAVAPAGTSYDNSTGLWTIGDMAKNGNATLTITATVDPSGNRINTATITATENDPNNTNNSASATTTPVAVANVSVAKTVNNSTPKVGSNVIFTIVGGNAGPSTATSVNVQDVLPNGYTFVSATSSSATSYNVASGQWTIGNLNSGANVILNITATVNASGDYTNTATIASDEHDPDLTDNTSTATTMPVAVADLSITKTVNNSNPNVGSDVTFTITIANSGPSSATNVSVTDALPDGYSFVSASAPAGTTYDSATGVWTVGTMAKNGNAILSIIATVNASGSYNNTATVTATEHDPNTSNNTASATTNPVPVADLSVTKTVDNTTPNVGTNVMFTITVNNAGPSDATNVKANDALPSGYTFISASAPAGTTYDSSTGLWNIGNLAKDAQAILTITAKVNTTGERKNNVSISAAERDLDDTNNTASVTTTPVPVADVSVSKTVSNNTPDVGSNVTFTIIAANAGPSNATNVRAIDLLPDGYTYVSVSASAGTVYDNVTGEWFIGTLPSGQTSTLNIIARVNTSGNYTNSVSITASEDDPDNTNNNDAVMPVPVPVADLSVIKTSNGTNSNVGDQITFNIHVFNNGPSDATNVQVNDLLPSGFDFVSATAPAGTTYDNTTGIWNIGNFASNNELILGIVVTIKASGDHTNTATITGTEEDPNMANNTSSVTVTPGALADISLTKTVDNATPGVGSAITFTVTATNAGPSDATGVNVNDLLPTGYNFVDATASAGTAYNGATGLWNIGNLANGATATVDITAIVNARGNYENTATGSANETDPDNANNTATAITVPVPVANVSVSKMVSDDTPDVGSNVTFTIIATNQGPSNATNILVKEVLANGYTLVSVSQSTGTSYNSATGDWTVGNLSNGANAILNITARVNASGTYHNTVTITTDEDDPDESDNTTTVTPKPVPTADLAVIKTVSNSNPLIGANVTFTVTATNEGPSDATNVKVTEVLPSGYSFVSANTPAGTAYDVAAGTWSIGNLANGITHTLAITATVKASGKYANTATIRGNEKDPFQKNNTSTVTTSPIPVANVSVIKTVNHANPNVGSQVIFTITAKNNGPSNATNVSVNDVLPSGYTFLSASAPAGTTYNSNTGLWSIGGLTNGANAVLTITATVNTEGNRTNTATVTAKENDPDASNNTASATTTPVDVADIFVNKTGNLMPTVGDEITFIITVGNNGPSKATGVSVTDLLPDGYTLTRVNHSAGTNYDATTGIWTVGNIISGSSFILLIDAVVKPSGNYTNSATAKANEHDPNEANNIDVITPIPLRSADLSITKSVNNSNPKVGSQVIFTVTTTNNGPSDASNVQVTDILPGGYTFVSASVPTGTSYSNSTGVWAIGDLAEGNQATLTVTATVKASGNYTNSAAVTADESDPDTSNNSARVTTTPISTADVSVKKTANTEVPKVEDNITFTITANNNGPTGATNVRVTDVLPTGYTFISASASTGTTYNTSTGVWTLGSLANGANSVLTITAKVNASGDYANTATIQARENDPDMSNNSATFTPTPIHLSDVAVFKTVSNSTPDAGSEVTFAIRATNNGPSTATNVVVNDPLPNGYTFISANSSTGTSYDHATGVWTIGSLLDGSDVVLTIKARVNATGRYANTATISADEGDPDASNNKSTSTPAPVPVADLSVVKTVSSATPNVGSEIVFTIVAKNAGPSTATSVKVNDLLPDGYTFVSARASGGATYDQTTGAWLIGTLTNGATATLNITAKVNAAGNYVNTATINAVEKDTNASNNTSSASTTPLSVADVSITKTAGTTTPQVGSNIAFTITVLNAGPSKATMVRVKDLLPSGYTFVSANGPYNTASGIWTVNDLQNGASATLVITARVNANGDYRNTASVTANEKDPNLSNNIAATTPIPAPVADLVVTKTVSDLNPAVGSNVKFRVTVYNIGPSTANNVVANDLLPGGYELISATPSGSTTYDRATGIWKIGTLLNGTNTVLTIEATVKATGAYTNKVTVTATEKDPDLENNTATSTPSVQLTANLSIAKSVNIDAPEVGRDVVFSITAKNSGPANAVGVNVVEALPDGYIFVAANAPGGTNYNPATGIWSIGNLDNGASITLTVTATVQATGSHANTVTISASTLDPDLSDNTATSTTSPVPNTTSGEDGEDPIIPDMKIPNLFTPNGDGINDTFEIKELSQFLRNDLIIINRWGNEVYRSTSYQNNWTGEGLNEGTYYYLLKVKKTDNSEWMIYKGWLTLIRSFR